MTMQQIQFGNTVISYTLEFSSRRKTFAIQVSEMGVKVIAPDNAEKAEIDSVLCKKAPWILQQLADFEEIQAYDEKVKFLSGEKLPYLGRNYRLKVYKEDIEDVCFSFKQGKFIAVVSSSYSDEQLREILYPLFKKWVMTRAKKIAAERVKRYLLTSNLNPNEIKIKDQQLRWGTCTASGNIILNWKVFLAPMPVIDYVIAHEMAHLKVMDHSQKFWETLEMLDPAYREKKEWLRLNGRKLYI